MTTLTGSIGRSRAPSRAIQSPRSKGTDIRAPAARTPMKLQRLHLPSFKNLRGLTIDFDKAEDIAVIVGRNGAGKSNVIEAITVIFRDLDLKETPSFAYEIEYIGWGQQSPSAQIRRVRRDVSALPSMVLALPPRSDGRSERTPAVTELCVRLLLGPERKA